MEQGRARPRWTGDDHRRLDPTVRLDERPMGRVVPEHALPGAKDVYPHLPKEEAALGRHIGVLVDRVSAERDQPPETLQFLSGPEHLVRWLGGVERFERCGFGREGPRPEGAADPLEQSEAPQDEREPDVIRHGAGRGPRRLLVVVEQNLRPGHAKG